MKRFFIWMILLSAPSAFAAPLTHAPARASYTQYLRARPASDGSIANTYELRCERDAVTCFVENRHDAKPISRKEIPWAKAVSWFQSAASMPLEPPAHETRKIASDELVDVRWSFEFDGRRLQGAARVASSREFTPAVALLGGHLSDLVSSSAAGADSAN